MNLPFKAIGCACALSLALFASGCGTRAPNPAPVPPTSTPEPTTSAEPTDSATSSGAPLASIGFEVRAIAEGFDSPLWVTSAGDGSGRLFVVEQGGLVKVIERGGKVADEPFLDVSRLVSSGGERGLLGLAFAPDYERSGDFYVNYTDRDGDTVVALYTADDPSSSAPKLSTSKPLLQVEQPYANHNGGCIIFGPDGKLWVGMGDGGAAGDPENRAQDDSSLLGKMLRLDVKNGSPSVPEQVQKGLRNPWRFSFDRDTDDLWIGDVGQGSREEIDHVALADAEGVNWGWNRWEGTRPYPPSSSRKRDGFTFPVLDYGHNVGESITGGYVYRGTRFPELTGAYLYGDFVDGWVAALRLGEDGKVTEQRMLLDGVTPSSFGEDEDGELYVVDYSGTVFAIESHTP